VSGLPQTLEVRVLSVQPAEALGVSDLQAATLAPPPIEGLLGHMLLATDVAHGSQRLGFL
jgi:hypothetical protein